MQIQEINISPPRIDALPGNSYSGMVGKHYNYSTSTQLFLLMKKCTYIFF